MSDVEHGRLPGTQAGFGRFGRVLVVRLGPGEDVLPAMERLLVDAGIERAAILSGVASLQHLTVRNIHRFPETWPIQASDRRLTTVPGPLEVLAMQGNVAPKDDGELVIHCHLDVSVGAPPAVTYGGHLVEDTIVGTTCELVIAEIDGLDVARAHDPITAAYEIAVAPTL